LTVVGGRYWALSIEERNIAYNEAFNVARVTTKYCGLAGTSSYCSVFYMYDAAFYATYELIGLDKL
jgi:hypothetical protein